MKELSNIRVGESSKSFIKPIISKHRPYFKSVRVLSIIQKEKIRILTTKKDIMNYVWNKLQKEIRQYWFDKEIENEKLYINEDNRLSIINYIIIQSQCYDLYASIKAIQPFVSDQRQEDAAPFATFESSI